MWFTLLTDAAQSTGVLQDLCISFVCQLEQLEQLKQLKLRIMKWRSGEVLPDEGGDGVDVSKELAGLPGPHCPPLCPAQPSQQRLAPLAGRHAHQQPRPRASK